MVAAFVGNDAAPDGVVPYLGEDLFCAGGGRVIFQKPFSIMI